MPKRRRARLGRGFHENKPAGQPQNTRLLGRTEEYRQNYLISIRTSSISAPALWRLLSIPAAFTFDRLNNAIAVSFGYEKSQMSQFEITMHSTRDGQPSGTVTTVLQDASASAEDREHTRVVSYAEDVHWKFSTMQETRLRDVVECENSRLEKWSWEYDRKGLALPRHHTVEFYGLEASTLRVARDLPSSDQPLCLGGEGCLWPKMVASGNSWEEMIGDLLVNNPYRWNINDVNRVLQEAI